MAIEKKQVEHYFSSIFANFFCLVHMYLIIFHTCGARGRNYEILRNHQIWQKFIF